MVDLLLTKHIISLSYYLASFFFYLYPFLISFYLLFYLFLLKSCIITFQYHFIRLFIFFLLLFVSFAIFLTLYSVIYDTCISLPHCVLSLSLSRLFFLIRLHVFHFVFLSLVISPLHVLLSIFFHFHFLCSVLKGYLVLLIPFPAQPNQSHSPIAHTYNFPQYSTHISYFVLL